MKAVYTHENQNLSISGSSKQKIILFGGTFEPPHVGHLLMARIALEQTGAMEVWFIPAYSPPHKDEVGLNYDTRLQMVRTLIENIPGLRLSEVERTLAVPSYTVDTVRTCQQRYPDMEFEFLVGTDSLSGLPNWHRAQELTENIRFLVAARSGYPYEQTYKAVVQHLPALRADIVEMPIIDLSSTWLRSRFYAQEPMCGLVPDAVLKIWREVVRPN